MYRHIRPCTHLSHLNSAGTSTNLRHALALEIDTMLRPDCGVIYVAPEVAETRHWWSVAPGCKSNAGDEPTTVYLTPVTAIDKPLVLLLVEFGTIYMLVIFHMLLDIPLLLNVFEVAP